MNKIMRKVISVAAFVFLPITLFAQVPVVISPVAKQQFSDVNGNPLTGGLLYTYSSGTSTPLSTYTDSTGTSQNTNPIVLDSGGFTPQGLFLSSNSYKFVLKNANGVTQWTVDGINAYSLLSANNTWTGNNSFTGTNTHSGTETFTGPVVMSNVTKFINTDTVLDIRSSGAKCDGSTDDSAAMQAAITSAIGTGKAIYTPPSVCAHASTLNLNSGSASVKILGTPYKSEWRYTGLGSGVLWKKGSGTSSDLIFTPFVSGVSFTCSAHCAKSVEAYTLSEGVFRDVGINGASGTSGYADVGFYCSNCGIINADHLILNGSSNGGGTNATIGLDCFNCSAWQIHNGDFFYFPTATMRFSGSLTAHITFRGNWFESQNVAILIDDTVNATEIDGMQLIANRFLFNALGGANAGSVPDQLLLKVNNTGVKAINIYGLEILANTNQDSAGLSSVAYPVVLSYSATTDATSHIDINLNENEFRGASAGIVNVINGPAASKTQVRPTANTNFDASGVNLATLVNGTAQVMNSSDYLGHIAAIAFDSVPNATSLPINGPTGSGIIFSTNGTQRWQLTGTTFNPITDNAITVGTTSLRPANVFTHTLAVGPDCASAASPAVCGASAAGSFVIAAGTTTVTVNTSAIGNNSLIFLTRDDSLSARLSVTCNTQSSLTLGTPYVDGRSTGTSFGVSIEVGPTSNPMCISYLIVN